MPGPFLHGPYMDERGKCLKGGVISDLMRTSRSSTGHTEVTVTLGRFMSLVNAENLRDQLELVAKPEKFLMAWSPIEITGFCL